MMSYQIKNRTKKERLRKAVVDVLEDAHPTWLSAVQVRDRVYDRLGHETPSTTAIGMLAKHLCAQRHIQTHRPSAGHNPLLSYRYNLTEAIE